MSIWIHGHFQRVLRSYYVQIYFLAILFNIVQTRDYSAVLCSFLGRNLHRCQHVSIGSGSPVRDRLGGVAVLWRRWCGHRFADGKAQASLLQEGQPSTLKMSITGCTHSSFILRLLEHTGQSREGGRRKKGAKKQGERTDAAAGLQEIKMLQQQQQSLGRKGEKNTFKEVKQNWGAELTQ